jgi:hypothetical protein
MTCQDCGGCTDDSCTGCGERWCGGAYMGEGCDRCPEKVDKEIESPVGVKRIIKVRCNSSIGAGHSGSHHWDPWKAGK